MHAKETTINYIVLLKSLYYRVTLLNVSILAITNTFFKILCEWLYGKATTYFECYNACGFSKLYYWYYHGVCEQAWMLYA